MSSFTSLTVLHLLDIVAKRKISFQHITQELAARGEAIRDGKEPGSCTSASSITVTAACLPANREAREKGSKLPTRPFNDNAPITRSITNSNKMMKDALIIETQTNLKLRRGELVKEPKTFLSLGSTEEDPDLGPSEASPPYNTPPAVSSPTSPPSYNDADTDANEDDNNSNISDSSDDDNEDV
jgi:hypothetical protein